MKLSLCAIAKNEEATLPKCLSSVRGVVDEIVLLDTGSSDRTIEVAQNFGARVYTYQWCNDFSAARNEALKYVQGDWVLVLDADEVLVPEIVPSLKQAINSDFYLVINLLRLEVGAAQSPYSLVSRLFRRHPHIYFSRPYHALIDDSVGLILDREPYWQIGNLPEVAILHEGYQKNAIASQNKFAKARSAMEGFLAHHPDDPYVCSKLGALYVESDLTTQGIELLERGLRSTSVSADILYELHYHLGIAYNRLQQTQKAIFHYQAAIDLDVYPMLKLGAYNNLGSLKRASGDVIGAKTDYEMALAIDPNFAMGYFNLGITWKALGKLNEAIAAYNKAIVINPDYAEAYQNLGVVLLKGGLVTESLAAFKQAIALHAQHNPIAAQQLRQGLIDMGFSV
ncbi:glycosyltransferase [Aliterella atlantica]|uniref:Glycosyltransferase n=1 Tax=Aliterella atlantica CENA595 TaxID=1618023 RepID=A0A0D8ZT38_9CYAN|nr:glycosyltransferase family 2 protein [Aliterella atlantica]KJH71905.1 glycosyltransferase [Aliterella atlantica CENA595]